jgi:hypothetical protein
MEHLKFIKKFGLFLIIIGLVISVINITYLSNNVNITNPTTFYNYGIISGIAIGLCISGGILRLYSSK